MQSLSPFPQRLAFFALWALLVAVAFFSIYPTMNWLTSLRAEHLSLFSAAELGIPFVPQMVWAYVSMYLLFLLPPFFLNPGQLQRLGKALVFATLVAGVIFVICPARLGFVRTLPDAEPYRSMFTFLFSIDRPYNLVPSLHVVYSSAIVLSIAPNVGRPIRGLLWLWLAFIMASTVLVHQHHIIDVLTGWALAVGAEKFMGKDHVQDRA
ncbi:MAG: phosphatase PAP2 family protein [Gallionellaceae bacterium]|jgi:membrane-associated phospholipid phosphatase|nr:phosphatase PAP2 family protein [Gallionellaceae bacterium]